MRKAGIIAVMVILLCILTGCVASKLESKRIEVKSTLTPVKQGSTEKSTAEEAFSPSFEIQPIDEKIVQRISGISWREGSPVSMNDLSYIKVAYWGFDNRGHIGELIVNNAVAQDVADIFKELYDNKFPIERIRLIDEYGADDTKSMEDNNTSAFNYREVEGKPGIISKHGYGLAIDINPVQNPYIYKDEISPESGEVYSDRDNLRKGMIVKNDICYKAFASRGWIWGGDWKYEKDYQHFQKRMEQK